ARLTIVAKTADGISVANASVQLSYTTTCATPSSMQGAATGTANQDGYYAFPGIPAGGYYLTVTAPASMNRLPASECVTLSSSELYKIVTLQPTTPMPTPGGMPSGSSSITVVVNDSSGGSVADANVEVQYCGITPTNPCVTGLLTKTPLVNEYRITSLGAGNFSIRVIPPSSRSDLMAKEWFPISPGLAASDQRREYVSLQKKDVPPPGGGLGMGTATLEITVKSPSGNVVDGAMIGLSRSGTCAGQSTTVVGSTGGPTSASGFVAFTNIPSGTYTMGVGQGSSHPELGHITQMCVTLAENQRLSQSVTLPWSGTGGGGTPTITGVYASNMSMSSADVYFTLTNASSILSEIKTGESGTWTQGPSRTFAPGELAGQKMITFIGLKSSTTYQYRLTASNASGGAIMHPTPPGTASFATMQDQTNPGSTLPPGDASVTVSVVDRNGAPLAGAMVGISSCMPYANTAPASNWSSGGSTWNSGSTWSSGSGSSWNGSNTTASTWSQPACSWASAKTTMKDGRASTTFANIMAQQYNIGVSPPDGRYHEFESVTSWPVTLAAGTSRNETITLQPKGGTVVSDLPIIDIRTETPATADMVWMTWNTPREADGRVELGTLQTYELGSFPTPAFVYRHEVKLPVKPDTVYYYRIISKDHEGRSGTVSGQFTTPKAGGDQNRPFAIDWSKSWPRAGERVDTALREIHVEFSRAVDESSLLPGIASLNSLDKMHSPRAELRKSYNGFNLALLEPLKGRTAYQLMVRGSIRSADGVMLGTDQYVQFSTEDSGDIRRGTGAITGVVKLLNGSPVVGATIHLRSEGGSMRAFEQKQQTSHSGEYSFKEISSGSYRIEVYPPAHLGEYHTPDSPLLAVAENQVIKNDVILLISEFIVVGSVTYDDGSPVMDAHVGAYRTGANQWVPPMSVDSQGHFKLLVGPGAWSVGVMHRPMPMPMPCDMKSTICPLSPSSFMPIFESDWYPPEPQPIAFDPNDTQKTKTINFKVNRSRSSASITGLILKPDGSPADTATTRVRLTSRTGDRNFSRTIELQKDGSFSSQIPPGSYEVRIETTDPILGSPMPFDIIVTPGEQKNVATLSLTRSDLSISGTVKTSRGKAAAGVRIEGWNKATNETVPDVTNEKGAYRLRVSRGSWIVRVASMERYSGSRESTEFVPESRLPASGVDFVVEENTTLIHGTLKNEKDEMLRDAFGYVRVAFTKRAKKSLFIGIPGAPVERGEFTLSLPEGSYQLEFEPPQGSKYFQAKPVSVTIESGDTLEVTIPVSESTTQLGATITGNLVDTAGSVIQGVPFTVYAGSRGRWYSAEGDQKTGAYSLPVPPAKKYAIGFEVRSDEYIRSSSFRARAVGNLEAGETQKMNLTVVRKSVLISGKALDSEGDPVFDVDVVLSSEPFYGGKTTFRDVQTTFTDDEGRFDFKVQPGNYYIRALIPDTSELVNPEEQRIDVKSGSAEISVTLKFRSASVVLKGKTMMNGKPVSARVWATSKTGGYEQDLTGTDGTYELMIAGNDLWRVAAIAEIDRCIYRANETPLPIGAQSSMTFDLPLIATRSCLPDPVSSTFDAAQPLVLENAVGVKVALPANAGGTTGSASLSITPEATAAMLGSEQIIGNAYDIRYVRGSGEEVTNFNSDLTLSFPYDRAALKDRGMRPNDLTVKFKTDGGWKSLENCIVDEENALLTCSDNHLTEFAIVAPSRVVDVVSPKLSGKTSGNTVALSIGKFDAKKIASLKVYRSTKQGDLGTLIASDLKKPSFGDKPKKVGTYYYTVRGVDKAGNESSSLQQVKVLFGKKK
ncbi:MAG: carboxypeptidase-like regulatory domain-containing protein, partial [Patescibacteria group bacterium]